MLGNKQWQQRNKDNLYVYVLYVSISERGKAAIQFSKWKSPKSFY